MKQLRSVCGLLGGYYLSIGAGKSHLVLGSWACGAAGDGAEFFPHLRGVFFGGYVPQILRGNVEDRTPQRPGPVAGDPGGGESGGVGRLQHEESSFPRSQSRDLGHPATYPEDTWNDSNVPTGLSDNLSAIPGLPLHCVQGSPWAIFRRSLRELFVSAS